MNIYSVYFDYQQGAGWEEVPAYEILKNSFSIETILHNNLQPTVNRLKMQVKTGSTTLNKLIANTVETLVYIERNGFPYFYGQIRNTYQLEMKARDRNSVDIEAVDRAYLFKKVISETVFHLDATVTEILEDLLAKAGLTPADYPTDTITDVVAVFSVRRSDRTTFEDVITDLLFEHGYIYYFDGTGSMQLTRFVVDDTTTTQVFNDSNIYRSNALQKKDQDHDSVEISYPLIRHETQIPVFEDTSGGNEYYRAFISLAPGEWYPNGASSSRSIYSEYRIQDMELYSVDNPELEWEGQSGIELVRCDFGDREADIAFRNTAGSSRAIQLFRIRGDAVLKAGENILQIDDGSTENTITHDCKYVTEETLAERLGHYLFDYYQNSRFQYVITSFSDYGIGTVVQVQNSGLGLDIKGRIVRKHETELHPGRIDYVVEQITDYQVSADVTQRTVRRADPRTPQTMAEKKDIIEGFEDEATGATVTPEQLDQFAVEINFPNVNVSFPPQELLTNLRHYEVQVSEDQSAWYSTNFSETDWRGQINQVSTFTGEFFIFQNLLKSFYEQGDYFKTFYFRIRQRTKRDEVSPWAIESVDISNYFTWEPPKLEISATYGGRNVTISWDRPDVFGALAYDLQISKDGSNWHRPATNTDPRAGEDNWKAVSGEWLTINTNGYFQALPLEGQNDDPPDPQATTYYYRARTRQTDGQENIGDWSDPVEIVAQGANATDVVRKSLDAERFNVQDLAAINAVFGRIIDAVPGASAGDFNVWYLEDYYDGATLVHRAGYWRVGTPDAYLAFYPPGDPMNPNGGTSSTDPQVALHGADLELTSSDLISFSDGIQLEHGGKSFTWKLIDGDPLYRITGGEDGVTIERWSSGSWANEIQIRGSSESVRMDSQKPVHIPRLIGNRGAIDVIPSVSPYTLYLGKLELEIHLESLMRIEIDSGSKIEINGRVDETSEVIGVNYIWPDEYVVSGTNGNVQGFSFPGTQEWSNTTGPAEAVGVAITGSRTSYTLYSDGSIKAVYRDGSHDIQNDVSFSQPIILADRAGETLYGIVGNNIGKIQGLQSGTLETGLENAVTMAIDLDDHLYICSAGTVRKIDTFDMSIAWTVSSGFSGDIVSVSADDGKVYLLTTTQIACLSSDDGGPEWQMSRNTSLGFAHKIQARGGFLYTSEGKSVSRHALSGDPNSWDAWTFTIEDSGVSTVLDFTVNRFGNVFAISNPGRVHIIHRFGYQHSHHTVTGARVIDATRTPTDQLVLYTDDGHLHRVEQDLPELDTERNGHYIGDDRVIGRYVGGVFIEQTPDSLVEVVYASALTLHPGSYWDVNGVLQHLTESRVVEVDEGAKVLSDENGNLSTTTLPLPSYDNTLKGYYIDHKRIIGQVENQQLIDLEVSEEEQNILSIAKAEAIATLCPVGKTYTQYPGKKSPDELGLPGVWENISSEFPGDFFRAEGGDALSFNGGQQSDQSQRTWGEHETVHRGGFGEDGVFTRRDTSNVDRFQQGSSGSRFIIIFDSANSPDSKASTSTSGDTWPRNRTIRIWERKE
ncbi:hypothetical protein [Spirochaeta africana]|uniref:Uncharacterized protein n=1 Tax=Spirochaeta africana (strain ATCC 700263 / DSM 8902 / Z-7692) TaxID=889378 RepID=H9UJD3_SPIAZ|nr:hypothetical protein [Spirochaeta africana]AFG37626.1 hypothetical protein Spiaf_1567 [Spirochaeta africana DSM 8902]